MRVVRLEERVLGKGYWNVVSVYGDEANRPRIAHFAQSLDHPRWFETETAMGQRLGQHEFTRFSSRLLAARDRPLGLGATVGRDDASVGMARAENTEDA